ncbi:MAG TPA: DNA-binding protein [Polyangiaceae bacterium]|nr:DNA-binding protein [Polyangiaceae bacterium]
MSDVDNQIREQIEAFVSDLNQLVRQAALEAVAAALGGDGAAVVAGRGGRAPGFARALARGRGKGAKRTAEELEGTRESVLDYVRRNAGQGVEQIAKALNVPSRDLVLPIRKLVAAGQLSTKGQKRATKYFSGSGGGGGAARGGAGGRRRGRRTRK